jgi:predicted lipoprotein with Yx(FWY)xxD motif
MALPRTLPLVRAGLSLLVVLLARPATAAEIPVCTAVGSQELPVIVSDDAGGAIIAWSDRRGTDYRVYAQRVNSSGTPQWATDGVPLCTAAGRQIFTVITTDGAGGAIVAWEDYRVTPPHIYAQRISAGGVVQWAADGVSLCTDAHGEVEPTLTSDGAGGGIVIWVDARRGPTDVNDIYAQRISAGGAVLWDPAGVALCTANGSQNWPAIVSDGASGAIVAWDDGRSGGTDIYAQRVLAGGTVQWTANGVPVCMDPNGQGPAAIASDGAHGALLAWTDYRSSGTDIYAQRISSSGTAQWLANGVAICTATSYQQHPTIVSDAAGGAIITWDDGRNALSTSYDIYAQRISAGGTVQWVANGVALCAASGAQQNPASVSDGASGAIVTWEDSRSGNKDIYAQTVTAAGTPLWAANGVALCVNAGTQDYPRIVTMGGGGAIVAWMDDRNGNYDIYAQTVAADGTPVLLSFVRADVGAGRVALTWYVGGGESVVATVHRCREGGTWAPIGEVAADGTGYLRFTDRADGLTGRVGYRLGIVEGGVEGFCGETWVDLPALSFALDAVRPNPSSSGTLTVKFALASANPASLELLDVAGRRVLSREVGSLGAGRHALDLGEGLRLEPGLYLLRLTQGGDVRATRAVVFR